MWFERFVIVVITLHRDFMPGAWAMYNPTIFDVAIYLGTFGLFFTGFLLFLRFLPMVSIAEAKLVLPESTLIMDMIMSKYGVIARFDSPESLVHAAEKLEIKASLSLIVIHRSQSMVWMMRWVLNVLSLVI